MDINYIILAHKNPSQLERLIKTLNADDTYFYIHLDKKVSIHVFAELLKNFSNVYILEEHSRTNSLWGSFGIVHATLNALQKIIIDNRKGYTVLLSGQCYPLKQNDFIKKYFKENYGYNFIGGAQMPTDFWQNGGMDRIEKYYFPMSEAVSLFYDLPYIFSRKYKFPNRFTFKKIVNLFLVHKWNSFKIIKKRKYPHKLIPFGGSAWWALPIETVQFIEYYIKCNPKYLQFHKYTLLPDEIFFHTIVYNHFRKIKSGVHLINWPRPNAHSPAVFKKEDFNLIKASEKLYARKFDDNSSSEVFDLIDKQLLNKNLNSCI